MINSSGCDCELVILGSATVEDNLGDVDVEQGDSEVELRPFGGPNRELLPLSL